MPDADRLVISGLGKSFPLRGLPPLQALQDVDLSIQDGHVVGLVGESGSGKTTLIRCLMGLEQPTSGSIHYDGMDVLQASRDERRRFQREVQLIFQDPYSSLDPRMTVAQIVGEGLVIHGLERSADKRRDRVVAALELVGLTADALRRYPREFSGGQRQRIAIARALVVEPKLLVCDEPVSALDVSVQAQVVNLMQDMQRQLGLTILFVAHDLAVVRHLCERLTILQHGVVVEEGTRDEVFNHPRSSYTRELLAAAPIPDPAAHRRGLADPSPAGDA